MMIKKTVLVALAAFFALALCSCGISVETGSKSTASQPSNSSQAASKVDKIDLSLEGGRISFNNIEKANAELTDANNALIFSYDFTNAKNEPVWPVSVFIIEYYQNGVELGDSPAYSSAGGSQYELVKTATSGVMNGGTATFGEIVVPKDNSPITVVVKSNGTLEKETQMMEVDISSYLQ